jgi:hypothetical protein
MSYSSAIITLTAGILALKRITSASSEGG